MPLFFARVVTALFTSMKALCARTKSCTSIARLLSICTCAEGKVTFLRRPGTSAESTSVVRQLGAPAEVVLLEGLSTIPGGWEELADITLFLT